VLIYLAAFELMLVAEAYFSYQDKFFSKIDVIRHRNGHGVAFLSHGAMWLDALLVSPLIAIILATYSVQWRNRLPEAVLWLLLATGLSVYMHFGPYKNDSVKKPTFIFHDGSLTFCGWLHLMYAAIAIWALLMFYFASTPSFSYALGITLALGVHIAIATIQPSWHLGLKEAFNPIALTIIIVGWILLGIGLWQLS
jgi:hypothetical protein